MNNLTLEDIARMAGVSPATVSRVINNQVGARSKVRERVIQVIEETGFQPHAAARSLASQRSKVIGLVIPAPASRVLSQPYLLQLTEVITQTCHESDYVLSLFLTGSGTDEQKLLPKIMRKGFMDGLIVRVVEGRRSEGLFQKLSKTGIPFVAAGRPTNSQHISYVAVDNLTAAYNAVTHLISLGHQRIALIIGSRESYPSQERLAGYHKALDDRGLPPDEHLIAAAGSYTESGGYLATHQLLKHSPDALFVAADRMAVGALRALSEVGRRVPDDISVVGFDDLPLAKQTEPPLTTMRQPLAAIGKRLVQILFDIIENGPEPPHHVLFDAELVIRASCGTLRS